MPVRLSVPAGPHQLVALCRTKKRSSDDSRISLFHKKPLKGNIFEGIARRSSRATQEMALVLPVPDPRASARHAPDSQLCCCFMRRYARCPFFIELAELHTVNATCKCALQQRKAARPFECASQHACSMKRARSACLCAILMCTCALRVCCGSQRAAADFFNSSSCHVLCASCRTYRQGLLCLFNDATATYAATCSLKRLFARILMPLAAGGQRPFLSVEERRERAS